MVDKTNLNENILGSVWYSPYPVPHFTSKEAELIPDTAPLERCFAVS